MGLFSNPRKELDEVLEGLRLNFGANGGSRKSPAVADRFAKALDLIGRLRSKGKASDALEAIDLVAAKDPERFMFARGLTPRQLRDAAETLRSEPRDEDMVRRWTELCQELRASVGP